MARILCGSNTSLTGFNSSQHQLSCLFHLSKLILVDTVHRRTDNHTLGLGIFGHGTKSEHQGISNVWMKGFESWISRKIKITREAHPEIAIVLVAIGATLFGISLYLMWIWNI